MVPAGQKLPLAHATFCDGVAHTKPTGQVVSEVEPVGHQLPAAHAICVDGELQYDPAAHAVWVVEPAGQ